MVFVGAAILPHGAMVFDGDPQSESPACLERRSKLPEKLAGDTQELYNGCSRVAELIAATNPELILLFTPHGLALKSGAALVYLSKKAVGNALWNECWDEISLNIELDSEVSGELMEHLQEQGIQVDGLSAFTAMEVPMRWGEVVPLWFVDKAVSGDMKYLIVSMPRPGVTAAKLPRECQRIGESVAGFIAQLKQRVAVVISGDLSHTHPTDCNIPLYLPDSRWNLQVSDSYEQFDEAAELWARGGRGDQDQLVQDSAGRIEWKDEEALAKLHQCMELQSTAKSCGIYGFGVLHGLLASEHKSGSTIYSHFLTRCAPTYYGMMCAYFEKQSCEKLSDLF